MSICSLFTAFPDPFLYPSILSTMFCLLTFLDDFRGVKLSFRWGPDLCSGQRLELFGIGLDLTPELVTTVQTEASSLSN